MLDLAVVAAVNDDEILNQNLRRSPVLSAGVPLRTYVGCRSASEAYNAGLDDTEAELVAFVHQDVYLPGSWAGNLARAIEYLDQHDPNWAVLGVYGIGEDGRHVGAIWTSGLGRALNHAPERPMLALSVDELAIAVRRSSGLRFDPKLPSFHLYGTDIVLAVRAAGRNAYVGNLPVIHNSRPVTSYGGGYAATYRYMRRKWWNALPVRTTCCDLTKSRSTLWHQRIGLRLRKWLKPSPRAWIRIDPVEKARELGYEYD